MAGRKNPFHLKRNTEGTSNELSFDVLDAARGELEGKRSGSKHAGSSSIPNGIPQVSLLFTKLGGGKDSAKASNAADDAARASESSGSSAKSVVATSSVLDKESVPGAIASATGVVQGSDQFGASRFAGLSDSPEVAQRKAARKRSKHRRRALVFLLVVAIVGVTGWGAYTVYQNMQLERGFQARFVNLTEDISDADASIVNIDKIAQDPLSYVGTEEWASAFSSIDDARNEVAAAEETAQSLRHETRNDEDVMAVSQAIETCDARGDLLDEAESIFTTAEQTKERMNEADALEQSIIEADSIARTAAEMTNAATTDEAVASARDKTAEALSAFEDVLVNVEAFDSGYDQVTTTANQIYLEKRIEALNYALASSDALLANDRETALSQNDLYNQAETVAAEMAAQQTVSLSQQIEAAFDQAEEDHWQTYNEARDRATRADAIIRDYLGKYGN